MWSVQAQTWLVSLCKIQPTLVSIRKLKKDTAKFSMRKLAIFRKVKEVKGLRGGVVDYSAQAIPQTDAEIAQKGRFRMRTSWLRRRSDQEFTKSAPDSSIEGQ